ncbi:hypothetical protein ACFLTJ_00885 [Chloroflexota bacterium]
MKPQFVSPGIAKQDKLKGLMIKLEAHRGAMLWVMSRPKGLSGH